jgi:hypothetical protein
MSQAEAFESAPRCRGRHWLPTIRLRAWRYGPGIPSKESRWKSLAVVQTMGGFTARDLFPRDASELAETNRLSGASRR